jgi:pyridoxal/pyridoxine/pyridoxamine kinase
MTRETGWGGTGTEAPILSKGRVAMFDDLKSMAEQALAGKLDPQVLASADPQAVGQAASEHLGTMDNAEITGHLQTATTNLQLQGQGDLAQQAMALVSQVQSNPSGAKDAIAAFVSSNPQILQHFAPSFAQGILSRIGL